MKQHKFPNIFDTNIGFTFHNDSELWDAAYRANGWVLSDKAGWFETYGDGMTQHSVEMICDPKFFVEWCLSFSSYCMAHMQQFEPDEISASSEGLSFDLVSFLLSVKHNPEKRRWYNMSERKVTSTHVKQYDTRWKEVPDWANGTIDGAVSLHWHYIGDRGNSLFRRLQIIESVKDISYNVLGYYSHSSQFNDIDETLRKEAKHGTDWGNAYEAYKHTIATMRHHGFATRILERGIKTIAEETQTEKVAPEKVETEKTEAVAA